MPIKIQKKYMKKLNLKIQTDFDKKNTAQVYNYCQCWQRFKPQIIKGKSYMAAITQNKQLAYFHCGS